MDKNQFTGLILMFGLLAVYFVWFAPDTPPVEPPIKQEQLANQTTDDATTKVETVQIQSDITTPLQQEANLIKYGAFAFSYQGEEVEQVIENQELKMIFTNKGGKIKKIILKNYNDYIGNPLVIMDNTKSKTHLIVNHNDKKINLSDLIFEPQIQKMNDTTEISYILKGDNFSLTQKYLIPTRGFQIFYRIENTKINAILNPTDIAFQWNHAVNRAEKNLEDARINSNVRYTLSNGDFDELDQRSAEYEEETLTSQIQWFSFKQKFFTSGFITNVPFKSGYINQKIDFADTSTVKKMSIQALIPYSDFVNGFSASYFFGPNNYSILKKVAEDFEENLDMGWGPLPIVNKYLIIPIFHLLEKFLSNYGLIILVIVIILRLILSPLTWKSHMSMAKMRVLKPELDAIKTKNDGDMQKTQQEQMKFYRQIGINPLSGCIPMLLQMPILFSLFFFFPNAVELRQQSFLWANDLSTYDSFINLPFNIPFYGDHVSLFTLLMTLSTILYTWSNSQITTIQGPMKTLQYIMPIMFLFVLNSYASGLTFYYFISNMATFGQAMLFKKIVNEDKINKILQENKKKNVNKKKSKFQTRLEEAMKASQEAQKKNKKKK